MKRPTRGTAADQAYLDLQSRARAEGSGTQAPPLTYFTLRGRPRAPSVIFSMGPEDMPCLRP